MWLIKQAFDHARNKKNYDNYTNAQILQTFINSKIDTKKHQPIEDFTTFLPYPMVWKEAQMIKKLDISRETAIEFLGSYVKFGAEVIVTFEEWIPEIKYIANH